MQIVISAGRINDTLFPTIKQTYGKTGGGSITDRTDGRSLPGLIEIYKL